MILIKKAPTTECRMILQHVISTHGSYRDLTSEEKNIIKDSLLKEQKFLCGYCMRRIDNMNVVKIEHIKPQSRYASMGLDYGNMLAVCDGNEGHPYEEQTCDTHKRDSEIKADPTKPSVIQTIRYKKSGMICSSDECVNKDLNEALNLNSPDGYLPRSRKEAVNALRKEIFVYNKRGKSIPSLLHKLEKQYDENNSEQPKLPPYVGILHWYVREKLKQYR